MDHTPADPLPPGTVIGRYTVDAVLGSGAMGTVYLAHAAGFTHQFALKVLRPDSPAPLAVALHHPNIVPTFEQGQGPAGIRWLAMSYVSTADADTELRAGRMPPERALRIVTEVAGALDHAHTRDIVHGDVKPSNFLLADDDRAMLADFGVARHIGESAPSAPDGAVLASAAYAAPEVLRGEPLGPAADVYALGCSLFRLLTGKPPFFDAGSKDAVVQAHLYRSAPSVTQYAPWLPAVADEVVATALAKDPAARHPSAGELAQAALALRAQPGSG